MRRYLGLSVALLAVCFLAVGASPAATVMVDLQAGVTTKTLPDSATVTMWGFGLLAGSPSVPGPQITVTEGDTLTLNVTNNLSGPVSLAIAGQISSMSPQFFMDGQGRQRVRSFTHETPVSATRSYTWTNLEAGTYMCTGARPILPSRFRWGCTAPSSSSPRPPDRHTPARPARSTTNSSYCIARSIRSCTRPSPVVLTCRSATPGGMLRFLEVQ